MTSKAYVAPGAIVSGKVRTLILKSSFGASIALGSGSNEVFLLEDGNRAFYDGNGFYSAVSEAVSGKKPSEVASTVMDFSRSHGLDVTRLIPDPNNELTYGS